MSENSNPKSKTTKSTKPKKNKREKKPKSLAKKILGSFSSIIGNIFLAIILAGCIGVYLLGGYVQELIVALPEVNTTNIQEGLTENSVILDKNGQVLEKVFGSDGEREIISYNDINEDMINALLAIEDKTFFEHKGFNYLRLGKAALDSITSGSQGRGTSTITQQLAKNVYLSNDSSLKRKIEEAYYAILLERNLTKEQILEIYFNKVNFGGNINGIQAAAQFYFSKDAKDLNFVESVIIAGIPKWPQRYAPTTTLEKYKITEDMEIIDKSDAVYTIIENPTAQARFDFAIEQMFNNNMITTEQYMLKGTDIFEYLNVSEEKANYISSYFGDMIKDDVIEALMVEFQINAAEAEQKLLNGGYKIYSTIDYDVQKQIEDIYNSTDFSNDFNNSTRASVKSFQSLNGLTADGVAGPQTLAALVEQTIYTEEDFPLNVYKVGVKDESVSTLKKALDELGFVSHNELFPKAQVRFNSDDNIIYDDSNRVFLWKYDNLVNENKQLVIPTEAYYYDSDDNMVILPNHGLRFYQQPDRVQVVVDRVFKYNEESKEKVYVDSKTYYNISDFYIYQGNDVKIDNAYKTKVNGNLVIDKSFFNDYPDFMTFDDEGNILIEENNYVIYSRGEIQPQTGFVLLDNDTGYISAIVGGRESYGKNIYNRALAPHQPGSSVKPIGAYTLAIESEMFTTATVMDDVPVFLNHEDPEMRWPVNWYEYKTFKYRGRMNLREALAQSVNVVAVKVADAVGVENIIDHFKDLGITTIEDTVGDAKTDLNLPAVSLGGMTKGISPLELAAAFATYENQGVYRKPISFTKVTDSAGNVIIENKQDTRRVIDEQVAYIVQDLMVSAITPGVGVSSQANLGGMTMAGKTGTTSDKRDAVFVGYTPYYTGAIWFGNDVRLKLDDGSGTAAEFWAVIMEKLHEDKEAIPFPEPEGLQRVSIDKVSGKRPGELSTLDPEGSQIVKELFLPGTAPTEVDDAHVIVEICLDNEKHVLANEYCTNKEDRVLRTRLDPYDPSEILDSKGNPIYTEDYLLTVPTEVCEIHDSTTFDGTESQDVIKAFDGGLVYFIRDYNLLLHNGNFKFVPKDSQVLIDNTIVYPDGTMVLPNEYNVQYIVRPETQVQAIFEKTQQEQAEEQESSGNN